MADHSPPPSPSETVRAGVTVALGLYLVGLLLCVAGNSAAGGSALVRTIHGKLFSSWMTLPWLDLGYDTRLTHAAPEDGDHWFEIRRLDDPAAKVVALPGPTMRGERAARWRRLARATAVSEADPDREALLPAAVGAGAFGSWNTRDLSLAVMRHLPPDRGDVLAGNADVAGRDEEAYAARVRLVDGEVQLIKATPPVELAPLVKEPAP
ncbi:MAG: hypothetical protein ACKOB1_01325 [Planctomycetia bacterium]